MPKVTAELKTQFQIDARKGKVFCVGGVKGLKCDYRREKPCYFLQWKTNGKYHYYYLNTTSLKEAKEKARKARALIDEGLDPNEIKSQEAAQKKEFERKDKERKANTLEAVTEIYFKSREGTWKGEDGGAHKRRRLVNSELYKALANLPISEITPERVFELFKDYWVKKPNNADKILTTLSQIYIHAIGYSLTESNPIDKRGKLGMLFKSLERAREEKQNYPGPKYQDVPQLLKECIPYCSMSKSAFIFQVLTATRGKATLKLEWKDIDFEKRIVNIQIQNDKMKKLNLPRIICLSEQVIRLLESLPRISEFVFPSREGGGFKPLGDDAVRQFLKGVHQKKKLKDGIGWVDPNCLDEEGNPRSIVPHATARSTFKTWSQEMKHNTRAVELCLFHKANDPYNGAYDKSELMEDRRQIMQKWADFCLQGIDLKELFS